MVEMDKTVEIGRVLAQLIREGRAADELARKTDLELASIVEVMRTVTDPSGVEDLILAQAAYRLRRSSGGPTPVPSETHRFEGTADGCTHCGEALEHQLHSRYDNFFDDGDD